MNSLPISRSDYAFLRGFDVCIGVGRKLQPEEAEALQQVTAACGSRSLIITDPSPAASPADRFANLQSYASAWMAGHDGDTDRRQVLEPCISDLVWCCVLPVLPLGPVSWLLSRLRRRNRTYAQDRARWLIGNLVQVALREAMGKTAQAPPPQNSRADLEEIFSGSKHFTSLSQALGLLHPAGNGTPRSGAVNVTGLVNDKLRHLIPSEPEVVTVGNAADEAMKLIVGGIYDIHTGQDVAKYDLKWVLLDYSADDELVLLAPIDRFPASAACDLEVTENRKLRCAAADWYAADMMIGKRPLLILNPSMVAAARDQVTVAGTEDNPPKMSPTYARWYAKVEQCRQHLSALSEQMAVPTTAELRYDAESKAAATSQPEA